MLALVRGQGNITDLPILFVSKVPQIIKSLEVDENERVSTTIAEASFR